MINTVTLVGRIGGDVEYKEINSVHVVAKFSVATENKYKDLKTVEWHRVSMWNKGASYCRDYIRKGDLVYIEGKLSNNKWTDKEGITRYTTEIIGLKIKLLKRTENRYNKSNTSTTGVQNERKTS